MPKKLIKSGLGFFIVLGLIACSDSPSNEPLQYDSVISNGQLVDGLGGSGRRPTFISKMVLLQQLPSPETWTL